MNNKLLDKHKQEKEAYRWWEQGHAAQQKYRKIVQAARNQSRKTKALPALNLAKDAKDNKKSFYRYIGDKRLEKVWALSGKKRKEELVMQYMEKSDVLNDFFLPVFTAECSSHIDRVDKGKGRAWDKEEWSTVED